MLRRFIAWLLSLAWQREEKVGTPITIDGITFQVSDFEAAANAIIGGIRDGKPKEDILASLEPALLPIVETIAGNFIPMGGAIVAVLAFAYSKSIPFKELPQDEQNAIMDRATANLG